MIFKDRESAAITKRTTAADSTYKDASRQSSPEAPERHSYNPKMDVDSGKFEEETKNLE